MADEVKEQSNVDVSEQNAGQAEGKKAIRVNVASDKNAGAKNFIVKFGIHTVCILLALLSIFPFWI